MNCPAKLSLTNGTGPTMTKIVHDPNLYHLAVVASSAKLSVHGSPRWSTRESGEPAFARDIGLPVLGAFHRA
jgi:hypothetical protein